MAGLPKRTSLRSSPEDAAFYRKYHDSTLSWLRKGTPRTELVQELVRLGVPEKTAERIVVAVEQEHEQSTVRQGVPRGKRWIIVLAMVVVFGGASVYVARQMSEDGTLKAKYLVPAGIFTLILSIIVIARLRGTGSLPPPPEPPA